VTLKEDPELIDRMVKHFYTLRYPEPSTPVLPDDGESAIVHAKMYGLGDKYGIPSLKDAAARALDSVLNNVGTHSSPLNFIRDLLPAVYETTPAQDRVCRDIMQIFITTHKWKLLGRGSVQEYALANHEFGVDLLKSKFGPWTLKGQFWCTDCARYCGHDLVGKCELGHELSDVGTTESGPPWNPF
jgi:hypothetical protein